MKKGKIIAGSLLSIIMCSSLITGATMALFTSESTTNIAATSGNVSVVATAAITGGSSWDASKEGVSGAVKKEFEGDDAKHNGYYVQNTAKSEINDKGEITKVTFTNNGSVYFDEDDVLTLDKITPGDSVSLKIDVINYSNVTANYRIKFSCYDKNDDGSAVTDYSLFDSLKISVPVSADTTYTKASLSGVKSYTTAWKQLPSTTSTDGTGTSVISTTATIELPLEIDSSVNDKSCKIMYVVEAVQGNAKLNDNKVSLEYITGGSGTATIEKINRGNTFTTVNVENAVTTQQTAEDGTVKNIEQQVSVSIPTSATGEANNVTVSVKETTVKKIEDSLNTSNNTNTVQLTTQDGSTVYAFDVAAYADGEKTSAVTDGTGRYEISFNIGRNVTPGEVYHKTTPLDRVALNDVETTKQDEFYTYNENDGTITVYTTSLSPFVISYLFGGGLGTTELPYLIYTADQLQGLANLSSIVKEKFDNEKVVNVKLMKDLTVNKTINISDVNLTIIGNNKTITTATSNDITKGTIRIFGSDKEADKVTVTINNLTIINDAGNNGASCVETRGGYMTLNLNNVNLRASAYIDNGKNDSNNWFGHGSVLEIGGDQYDEENKTAYSITVNVTDSDIKAAHYAPDGETLVEVGYAIIAYNTVNLTLDHANVSGYSALYMRGMFDSEGSAGSVVEVKNNSVLESYLLNTEPEGSTDSDFGVIVIADGYRDKNVVDMQISIDKSTIKTTDVGVIPKDGEHLAKIVAISYQREYAIEKRNNNTNETVTVDMFPSTTLVTITNSIINIQSGVIMQQNFDPSFSDKKLTISETTFTGNAIFNLYAYDNVDTLTLTQCNFDGDVDINTRYWGYIYLCGNIVSGELNISSDSKIYNIYLVSNQDELIAALNKFQTGETIKLMDDINIDENIEINDNITIDLNGHTITRTNASA